MALPKSDSMVVHTGGYRQNTTGDITDEVIPTPFAMFSIETLLAANTLPDIPEDDFDINAVTESELSFNMMNNHLTNLPSPLGEQGVSVELSEQQKKEEEEDARLAAQYLAERERRPKGTLTKLKANDIERGLHADTVKTPPRVGGSGRLATPPTGPRNWSRDITNIPRSPGTWNLNLYDTGAKEYKLKETYSENTPKHHESNGVFGHLGEKRDAIRMQRQQARGEALAMLFIHGMRYNPTDPDKDQGFTSILIPCPPEMKLEDVIRAKFQKAGNIYHSQMCQTSTIPGSNGSRTANIIFVNQPQWIDDEDALAKLSIIADKPAYKLNSKTWPMSDKMMKDIADGATRTIMLTDCPNFGSLTGQQLQDALVNGQGLLSPCHYALGHQILLLDSDGIDKVCIVMNSISNAINFMKWLKSERRAFGVQKLKWHFGLDISMTDSEVAHHEEITTMRREMQARNEERGEIDRQELPTGEADGGSPSTPSKASPSSTQAATGHSPVDTPNTENAITVQHDASLSSLHVEIGGTKVDTPTIDKITIARDASSSSLYSGPLAYKPCTGLQLNPTAANFSPAQKQFAFAPFPSVSGSFYPNGPTEAQRGELYKRANRQAYKEDKGPGFVYPDGPVRPQTPGRVEVPKMGLYQPKGTTNWADEEDDEDFFDAGKLKFSGGFVPPPPTPSKVNVPAIQVETVGENGTIMDESRPYRQGAMSYSTANPHASIADGSLSPQHQAPSTHVALDRNPACNYSFFGAQAYHQHTAEPSPRSGGGSSTRAMDRFSTQSVVRGTARDDDFVYEPYQPVRGEGVQNGGEGGGADGEDGDGGNAGGSGNERVKGERKVGGVYER